jgi:hypothetical protein
MEGTFPNVPSQLRLVPQPADSAGVILAEKFLAIRYMALIRGGPGESASLDVVCIDIVVWTIIAWSS